MRKVKIYRKGTVNCPQTEGSRPIIDCYSCPDLFGIIPYSHVNCKRGDKKDIVLKKSKNKKRNI